FGRGAQARGAYDFAPSPKGRPRETDPLPDAGTGGGSPAGPPSPGPAAFLRRHRGPGLALEGLLELGHVDDRAVDPVAAWGMRVRPHVLALAFGGGVAAPDLGEAEEEALLRGESVERQARLAGPARLVGLVGEPHARGCRGGLAPS